MHRQLLRFIRFFVFMFIFGVSYSQALAFPLLNITELPSLSEGGSSQTFEVSLSSNPSGASPVTIDLSVDAQLLLSDASLCFNQTSLSVFYFDFLKSFHDYFVPTALAAACTDWNVPQVVTVNAVDDAVYEGYHSGELFYSYTDPGDGGSPEYVSEYSVSTFTIQDNDSPSLVITPMPSLAEGGATQSYNISLSHNPTGVAPVVINLSPDAQVATGLSSVCFNPTTVSTSYSLSLLDALTDIFAPSAQAADCTDWNVPQTITVSAVDDTVVEGLHSGVISYSYVNPDEGGSPEYDQSYSSSTLSIADNDSAAADTDTDPITDAVENAGPNGGDGNGDGTPDSAQTLVATTVNPFTDEYETFEVTSCPSATIESYDFQTESSQSRQDSDFEYPYGLKHLKVSNCSSANFVFYLSSSSDVTLSNLRKFGPASIGATPSYFVLNDVIPVSYSEVSIGGKTMKRFSFTIQDNGIGDANSASNVIEDPIGPAFPNTSENNSCDQKEPKTPKIVSLTRKKNVATFTFNPAFRAERYQVTYSTNENASNGKIVTVKKKKQSDGTIVYVTSNLDSNKTYYFKVRSDNGCNEGTWSKVVMARSMQPGLPSTGRGE